MAFYISTRQKMFAVAIPICEGGNPKLAHNVADVNVAVWAFHGEKDEMAPVTCSRDMIAGIKKAGGNPRYTEYPDTGHNLVCKSAIRMPQTSSILPITLPSQNPHIK